MQRTFASQGINSVIALSLNCKIDDLQGAVCLLVVRPNRLRGGSGKVKNLEFQRVPNFLRK